MDATEIVLNIGSNNAINYQWVETNRSQMKIFLSLLFHVRTTKLSRIKDYWETHPLFNLPFFRVLTSRNRFMKLFQVLHFVVIYYYIYLQNHGD